jgi:hypothetical protein
MCTDSQHKEKIDLLKQLVGNSPIDGTYQISSTRPYSLDYKERKYIYLWSTHDLTLSLEELGNLPISAGNWINLSLSPGMRIFAVNQTTLVPVFIRCTDDQIDVPDTIQGIKSPITPYASNPTQTAAAGADTLYTFGTFGNTVFNHVSGQNNTAANVYLAFDQSTTVSGNQVYVIAPGQAFNFDRSGTVLHFSSPSQVAFGGTSGITIEAFA